MHPKYFQNNNYNYNYNYNYKEINPEPKKIDEMKELYQQCLEQAKVDAEKIYISILKRVRSEIKAGNKSVRVYDNWQNKRIYLCLIDLFVKDGFTVVEHVECFDVKGWA